MKKYIYISTILSFTLVLLLTGCTRTASKTPFALVNGAEEIPVEIPTKTLIIPKVIISTPSLEIEATPTMKPFVPTAIKEGEETKSAEGITGIQTEVGILGTPSEIINPLNQITLTVSPTEMKTTPTASWPTKIPYPVLYGNPGLPTISILSIIQDSSIVLLNNEFPINKSYTVHIGPYSPSCYDTGNDLLIGTFNSGNKGSFTSTYKIPSSFQGFSPLTVRMKIGDGAPFCFFFYNANY
jgi:hypothetical protein